MLVEIRLHNGYVKAIIMLLLENPCKTNIVLSPPFFVAVYIQNLSCIVYNISFFNCTWHIKAEAPKDIQIFFSYR